MASKTSDCTYKEFVQWAIEKLVDAVITGGLKELKVAFEYGIMVYLHAIYQQGGFKKED